MKIVNGQLTDNINENTKLSLKPLYLFDGKYEHMFHLVLKKHMSQTV